MSWQKWGTLEIELDGGKTTENQNGIYKSGALIELITPTKTGYTFKRWEVINGDGEISGNLFTMLSEDTKITAIWEINTYEITYNATGGSINSSFITSSGNYEYNVPISGNYKLEVWGAQGGYAIDSINTRGGCGGYSSGTVYLEKDTILNVVVGGQGINQANYSKCISGGYNGGGASCSNSNTAWGSGKGENIISGGFGYGGGSSTNKASGGGGGYYGGGTGYTYGSAGGGGSGYIGNGLLGNKVMYCYECSETSTETMKTVSTKNISEEPKTNYAKIGNGAAKITYISN